MHRGCNTIDLSPSGHVAKLTGRTKLNALIEIRHASVKEDLELLTSACICHLSYVGHLEVQRRTNVQMLV